jgi:uncharacterized protein YciI
MRFIALLRRGPAWEEDRTAFEQPLARDHLEAMRALHERGPLLLGGPFAEDGPIAGMAVLEAGDEAEARDLMAADPAQRAGVVELELHRMHVMLDAYRD